MKRKIYLICLYTLFLILIIYLFINKTIVTANITSSLILFITKVFPSLFPMFIISDLLISLNLPYYLNKYTSKITKFLFNIEGSSTYIFIMSLLSGTPSNALITKELLNKNYLSQESATTILSYTLLSNPLFLYTMLTMSFTPKISLILILNNYLANIILGIIIRKQNKPSTYHITLNKSKLSTSFISAITKSIQTLLMILGTIICFNLINISTSHKLLNTFISCLLEITGGLSLLSTISINISLKIIIATITISLTGLCIHTQIKSIIADTSINYPLFLKNRLLHLVINLILSIIPIIVA